MTNLLFASTDPAELEFLRRCMPGNHFRWNLYIPENPGEASPLVTSGTIHVAVTDMAYNKGALLEELSLWNYPTVILAEKTDLEKLSNTPLGITTDILFRGGESREYLQALPFLVRKVLNAQESLERHNSALRNTERRFYDLVQALPDIVYSLDNQGRITFINNSITVTGWKPEELLGKHFSVLLDPAEVQRVSRDHVLPALAGTTTGAEAAPKLFDERRTGDRRTQNLEIRLPHRNGVTKEPLYGTVTAYGEINAAGFLSPEELPHHPGTVGIIRDVTHRVETDQLLRQGLEEKEALLSEIHHRVKNNLQVISSLLNLQAGAISSPQALCRFTDVQNQIQSMSLIHEYLYQSDHFDQIDISIYARRLADHLLSTYCTGETHPRILLELDSLTISLTQAVPAALLLNEVISNCLRWSCSDRNQGTITVRVELKKHQRIALTLTTRDITIPRGKTIAARDDLGRDLVNGLIEQLGGELPREKGAPEVFEMVFPRRHETAHPGSED
ncbi:PAS domain S-box-containing protein [Alkalispirochaeta americana]|uniref:histidine kinase n=1 Tax=Alkalispirochaeta americana TaxID=159291 RepID=A0A1N6QGG2_9SPIO|nr:histidine kinase dimerization/phosphoacceptor domain -containing protein [Alkalispirochaeta americana]SIQ15602.1 PAS domain S-box-containing protein [Alkalispirochaeta americana]